MEIKNLLKIVIWSLGLSSIFPFSLFAGGIIPPNSPLIRYSGRVLFDKTNTALFDWPGVSIHVSVQGTEVGFLLDGARNNLQVKVDGKTVATWVCKPFLSPYWVRGLAPGWHQIEILKRTEGTFGPVAFKGMLLGPKGEARPPQPAPQRRVEIIGDSWVCGYGNESTTLQCKDLRPYENADRAFGALTAQALGAEYHLTAYSGRGVVRNYGEPAAASKEPYGPLFGRTLVANPDLPWDFKQWVPDAVVIHLGLNDFSTEPKPNPQTYIEKYRELIQRVRSVYPRAHIFCLATTGWPFFSPLIEEAVNSVNRAGDSKVIFVGYPSVPLSELGCDYHPQVVAHQHLADLLVPVIRQTMGWN